MALIDDIKTYWKLDEASGTLTDEEGNVDLDSKNNTPVYGATGILGDAVTFDGNGEYFYGADDGTLDFGDTDDFSFNWWFQQTDDATDQFLFSTSVYPGTDGVHIGFDGSASYIMTEGWAKGMITSSLPSQDTWHMYTYTRYDSGTDWDLYIDGTYSDSASSATTYTADCTNFYIGETRTDRSPPFIVDEFGVWNKRLSGDEITALWNSGDALAYPFAAGGTNMQINVGDVWKDIDSIQINIGDSWKAVASIKENITDSWKEVF